jgi:integrase
LDYAWADGWVKALKADKKAPATIRHHVGALARCLDWCVNRYPAKLPAGNPLRQLPRGYSTYMDGDTKRGDTQRDRRLQPGEEERLRQAMADYPDWLVLFTLLLETAMRLREAYTLTVEQIDLAKRTINLDKTKNGRPRQVPLSSVAVATLRNYLTVRETGPIFPWRGEPQQVTSRLSRQFQRFAKWAGCADLHAHDLRHEAISRFYERTTLDGSVIRRFVGHVSEAAHLRYQNLRAEAFADRLW